MPSRHDQQTYDANADAAKSRSIAETIAANRTMACSSMPATGVGAGDLGDEKDAGSWG
jgi:hypothetical protein